MTVFRSLKAALDAGYSICERTDSGYLVRIATAKGWAKAVVDLRTGKSS